MPGKSFILKHSNIDIYSERWYRCLIHFLFFTYFFAYWRDVNEHKRHSLKNRALEFFSHATLIMIKKFTIDEWLLYSVRYQALLVTHLCNLNAGFCFSVLQTHYQRGPSCHFFASGTFSDNSMGFASIQKMESIRFVTIIIYLSRALILSSQRGE